MDFQKEKEAFESVFTEAKGWDLTFIMGCYQNIETLRAFAGWLAAKAQAVPKWISVKDSLPPANILVLGMSQTRSNIFNIYNVMALDEFEEVDVTHWMHLPQAPKAQEQSHECPNP